MPNKQKMNYNKECNSILNTLDGNRDILLHACCAPCSSAVLLKLQNFFNITLYYYNPNIDDKEEYNKRIEELKKLIIRVKHDYGARIDLLIEEYNPDEFYKMAVGKENCPEGGIRCKRCYNLRIGKTATIAKTEKFDYFCSTLSISPMKKSSVINQIGFVHANKNTLWLPSDFKKENGYLNSVQLSKKYELYRQDYCGCSFSKDDK